MNKLSSTLSSTSKEFLSDREYFLSTEEKDQHDFGSSNKNDEHVTPEAHQHKEKDFLSFLSVVPITCRKPIRSQTFIYGPQEKAELVERETSEKRNSVIDNFKSGSFQSDFISLKKTDENSTSSLSTFFKDCYPLSSKSHFQTGTSSDYFQVSFKEKRPSQDLFSYSEKDSRLREQMSSAIVSPIQETDPPTDTCCSKTKIIDQNSKYVIQLQTDEFDETDFHVMSIHSFRHVIVNANHREDDTNGGYVRRELRKIFVVPDHVDLHQTNYFYDRAQRLFTIELAHRASNLSSNHCVHDDQQTSYLSNDERILDEPKQQPETKISGNLQVTNAEKPLTFDQIHGPAFQPITFSTFSTENGDGKQILLTLDLADYQPEDIKVLVENQELIVKAEKNLHTDSRKSTKSFFQSTTLPRQMNIDHLQSNFVDGKLVIQAPYVEMKALVSPIIRRRE